jgi:hypothetical protein
MTPEQRREMYDRMAERQLERVTEYYNLSDEQQQQVKARLDELKTEQEAFAAPRREQFRKLREEMYNAYRQRRDGQPVDEARMDQIRDQMREMWQGSPLMNPDNSIAEIEKLLPADQVEEGRQRREAARAEMEQRMREWRQRRGDRGPFGRDRDGGPGGFFGGGDPWDRYVNGFIRRYQLDEGQQASAQSVLQELKTRRDSYRETHAAEFEALRDMEDRDARRESYQKLNEPLDSLFDQLQERLAKIPTRTQMLLAEASAPTSRPAGEGPTSRPADDGSRFGVRRGGDRGDRGASGDRGPGRGRSGGDRDAADSEGSSRDRGSREGRGRDRSNRGDPDGGGSNENSGDQNAPRERRSPEA